MLTPPAWHRRCQIPAAQALNTSRKAPSWGVRDEATSSAIGLLMPNQSVDFTASPYMLHGQKRDARQTGWSERCLHKPDQKVDKRTAQDPGHLYSVR